MATNSEILTKDSQTSKPILEKVFDFARGVTPQKAGFTVDIIRLTDPKEIAKKYIEVITRLGKNLTEQKMTPDRIVYLEQVSTTWNILGMVFPVVMTIISGVLVFLTQNVLAALTNLANAFPPFFVNRYKTKTENWYKGQSYKFTLDMLQIYIERLAADNKFTDDILRDIDNKLREIGEKIVSLGSA